MLRIIRLVGLFVGLLCAVGAADAKLAANKLSANKLAANKLAANKLAANKLAAAKLTTTRFALDSESAADILATEESREVLSFILSCALPEGVTVTATGSDGTEYEFFGEIGLAKSWLRGPLGKAGQGWVSACLLARVNDSNVPLPISMRGAHPALAADDDEIAGWPLEEGAFYGNLFAPAGEDTSVVCRGRDQAAGETGGLIERDCAEPDPGDPSHSLCGFTYAGDCGNFTPAHACKKFNSKKVFYKDCHDQPIVKGARKYRQVITVFAP